MYDIFIFRILVPELDQNYVPTFSESRSTFFIEF